MSFPRSSRYGEHAFEWNREVPSHWHIFRLKQLARESIKNGIGAPADCIEPTYPRYIRITDIKSARELHSGTFRSLPPEVAETAPVFVGDILFACVGATYGKAYLHALDTGPICYAGYLAKFSPCNRVVPEFISYWAESAPYWAQLEENVIQSTVQNFSAAKYQELRLAIPPIEEQACIVRFLDEETARIDALIAEQERLNELLQEKRQAVISHAVTKGLNPDRPMKPSGNKWLRCVPAHWTVKKLKHVKASQENAFVDGPFGSNLKSEHFVDNGDVYVIESGFATRGFLEFEELKLISFEHFRTISRSEVREGDIVIAKIGARFGRSSILPELDKPAVVSGNSLKLTVDRNQCEVQFVNWLLLTLKELGVMDDIVNATAQPALSLGEMNSLPIAVPPIAEQGVIVDVLRRRIDEIDALSAEVHRAVTLLRERRSALISAAVTGQIDVRGLVGHEAA